MTGHMIVSINPLDIISLLARFCCEVDSVIIRLLSVHMTFSKLIDNVHGCEGKTKSKSRACVPLLIVKKKKIPNLLTGHGPSLVDLFTKRPESILEAW